MSNRGGASRHIGIGILVLLVAGLIVVVGLTWAASQRLNGRLDALRTAGEPLSMADLTPKPVSADRNAATYLASIGPDLDAFSKEYSKFEKTPEGKSLEASQERGTPLTPTQLAALREMLDRYPRILPVLQRATQCDAYATLLDYQLPRAQFDAQIMQSVSRTRNLAWFASWRIAVLTSEGKPDDAIQIGMQLLRVSRMTEAEAGMVSYLVAVNCRGMACDSINKALRAGGVSSETHAALEQELSLQSQRTGLAGALIVERAMNLTRTDDLFDTGGSLLSKLMSWKTKDWKGQIIDLYRDAIAVADSSWVDSRRALNQASASAGTASPVVANLFPALQATTQAANRVAAQLRALRILNALTKYRQKNGTEAAGLGDLALPIAATIDPFSGLPLKMKSTLNGWIIYSIMDNGLDDGGDFKDLKDWGVAPPGYGRDEAAPSAVGDEPNR